VIEHEPFGVHPSQQPVHAITLVNSNGMRVRFLTYGGVIQSLVVPDANGVPGDVVLGYDTLEEYLANPFYFGALIGRSGNRIAHGRFTLDGVQHTLSLNNGEHHLHGGASGLHQILWDAEPFERAGVQGAVLTCTSAAGSDGYPGNLDVRVTYTLTDDDEFTIEYFATTDAPTPVNLTQHTYFNLSARAGSTVLDHELTVNASRYTPVDAGLIPLGNHRDVDGTPFDFRAAHAVGRDIASDESQVRIGAGYDHNFVLDKREPNSLDVAARLHDPQSGRVLQLSTTEPGVQVYAGGTFTPGLTGKGGATYPRFGGIALETQHFPDAPNQPSFPTTILRPGREYRSTTVWRFGTEA
jgi:aldose 1-epimerase